MVQEYFSIFFLTQKREYTFQIQPWKLAWTFLSPLHLNAECLQDMFHIWEFVPSAHLKLNPLLRGWVPRHGRLGCILARGHLGMKIGYRVRATSLEKVCVAFLRSISSKFSEVFWEIGTRKGLDNHNTTWSPAGGPPGPANEDLAVVTAADQTTSHYIEVTVGTSSRRFHFTLTSKQEWGFLLNFFVPVCMCFGPFPMTSSCSCCPCQQCSFSQTCLTSTFPEKNPLCRVLLGLGVRADS